MVQRREEHSIDYLSNVVLLCGVEAFVPGYDPCPGSVARKQICSALSE